MTLLILSLAPIAIIAFFIYIKDKYEKEPKAMLAKALLFGGISVIPIFFIETYLSGIWDMKVGANGQLTNAAYNAFVVAAFTEELFKCLVFILLIWRNKNFNEMFDGIVYAVYISLGFAAVENVLYVFNNGMQVAILRAFTAVPAHAMFGVSMGFFFAFAKFGRRKISLNLLAAILTPIILHGFYDFIIFSKNNILLALFIPYIIVMLIVALKKMKQHSEKSVFKNGGRVTKQKISIIAAVAQNNVIGKDNKLIWHISEDLKRFKKLTSGHAIIMGRKTYESLPIKPLPNRKNIVITSNRYLSLPGAIVVNSAEEAIEACKEENEIFICGGASVYKYFIPKATNMYLTFVQENFDGDTFFPDYNLSNWNIVNRIEGEDKYKYTFEDYERK